MLSRQLVAAIGKTVSPSDFAEYMEFHYRKIFADAYRPKPFCFAVRRSDLHSPEGTISIEKASSGNSIDQPILTLCARSEYPRIMEFALNASTNVKFTGPKYLHAWL